MQNNLSSLESNINYTFNDKELLNRALIHPSYANENNIERYNTNQRLEFLGDAVLEVICSEKLYFKFPKIEEGKLTKLRAKLVCEENLSNIARLLEVDKFLLLGKGENRESVKLNDSIMCDAIEAILGAIYIDGGLDSATKFCEKYVLTEENINKNDSDYKSLIQEYVNANDKVLEYRLDKELGPDHEKIFFINLLIDGIIIACGNGKSKKEAEQIAARLAYLKIIEGNTN